MKLAALQRTMARAVMQPLTQSERMQKTAPDGKSMRAYASRFIKPNDRLTSFERLEIYNRQYWFRVLSCMMEDFPGLRAVLGERRFEEMSKAFSFGLLPKTIVLFKHDQIIGQPIVERHAVQPQIRTAKTLARRTIDVTTL